MAHYEIEKISNAGPEEMWYMQYARMEQSTIDYRKTEFDQRSVTKGAAAASKVSNASLKSRAATNVDAAIELGLRYASGYKCHPAVAEASTLWFGVLNNSKATSHQLARAHSCIATVGMNTKDQAIMRKVLTHAETAASLGLVTSTALMLVRPMSQTLLAKYPNLRKAREDREAEMDIEKRDTQARAAGSPMRYACAAVGCGMRASSGKALKSCGGKCELPYKPSYCSVACQKEHWSTHKPTCKATAKLTEEEVRIKEETIRAIEPPAAGYGGVVGSSSPALSFNVPGTGGQSGTTYSSSSIDAEEFKEWQADFKNQSS